MKHLRWLCICLVICFAFGAACPTDADARPAKKSDSKTTRSVDKKKSAKLLASNKKEYGKSSRVAKKSKKAERQSKKSGKDGQAKQAAERDVWLKRARESELLLSGKASWYGKDFHNKNTASGVKYDMHTFTAAHRTLPLGTVVKVTDQHNGKSVMVCVTDRGPYVHGRIIDVSYAAAKQLDLKDRGVGKVKLEVVSDEKGAPLKSGHAYFVKYGHKNRQSKVGPFHAFADAAAMHEALRQAHPDAQVILDKSAR